jgi:hypothetical protein
VQPKVPLFSATQGAAAFGYEPPVVAPAPARVPRRAARAPGEPPSPPGIARHLGAAASLHVLALLAGARLDLGDHAAKLPAKIAETTRDVLIEIARARPASDERPSDEEPPGVADGAGRRRPGPPVRSAGGDPERRSAPRPAGPGGPAPQAAAPDRSEVAPPAERPVLPGERAGLLEAMSRAAREPIRSPPRSRRLPADVGQGAGVAGDAPSAPPAAASGNGSDPAGGAGGRGKRSGGRGGGPGWGEAWDYVTGPRPQGLAGPASLRDSARANEVALPRGTINDVVSRSSGRLRRCYEDGLRREPGLAGRIPVRFAVSERGSVIVAADGGATVADPAVVRCVLGAFAAMTFPARPAGGVAWGTYLVAFPFGG